MREEEKKAIEKLKLMEYKYTLTNNDDKAIELILNLIERLQEDLVQEKEKIIELEKLLEEKTLRIGFENTDDYIPKEKLYKHIEMLEKENCHETCGVKKLIDCSRQCSIGCTIKNIKKILEE